VEALQRAKAAESASAALEARVDQLEAALATEREARSHADGQLEVYRLQIDRVEAELTLWEGRARATAQDLHDLYAAVSSSHQSITLPPPPKRSW
jgi:chromosome segregation ATPase